MAENKVENKEIDEWMEVLLEEKSEDLEVIIEIPKGSRIKYEYDKDSQRMICDRVLSTPFTYFFNYGYIPNTLRENGNPLDAVVLMEDSLLPGCSIRCRLLGILETSDENGDDPKLIVCPISKIDRNYEQWEDVLDVSISELNKLKYFFSHYKDLEEGSFVEVGNFIGREDSKRLLIDSRIHYYSSLMDSSLSTMDMEKDMEKI
jgi:inorganic pyrophosphatase